MDQLDLGTIVTIIIGLVFASIGIISIIDGLESKKWKVVKGTIQSIGVTSQIELN